tara:strand:- start:117 stop:818 length:702 start_codon:yes stop_codon:yes gene_type:complete
MDQIKIIGTSHIAKQSIRQIKRAIKEFKPTIVAVELDEPRYLQLMERKKRKVRLRDIRSLGTFGAMFYFLGAIMQKILGRRAGSKPGQDMKTGILEAQKQGAKVALIDRDIRITVRRLSTEIPIGEKLNMFFYFTIGWIFDIRRPDMKRINLKTVPNAQLVRKLIGELRHKFPNFYRVLVSERDTYMKHQIKIIHDKLPTDKLLVIVGAGHKEKLERFAEKITNNKDNTQNNN